MLLLLLAVGGDIVWHSGGTGKGCPAGEGHLSRAQGSCTILGLCLTLSNTKINCNSCSGMRQGGAGSTALSVAQLPSFIQC